MQRSTDGSNFVSINNLTSKGNSATKIDYDFTDNFPLKGLSYYRIKQVDKTEKYAYGNVVVFNFANKDNALLLYPNPTKDNVTLSFYAKESGILLASIVNAKGVVVKEFTIHATIGQNNYQVSLAGLAAGSHIITLKNNTQSISNRFEKL